MLRDQAHVEPRARHGWWARKEANLSDVKIYRQKGNSPSRRSSTSISRQLKKSQQPDVFLQPYDVIEVTDTGFSQGRSWLRAFAWAFSR